MDDLIAFILARLDEDKAAAKDAAWHHDASAWKVIDRGDLNPLTKRPRSRTLHDVRYSIVDSLDDRVTGIDAEASDDGGIAAHVARHDPARALRRVAVTRNLIAEIMAIRHVYIEGDSWFSCSQAVGEWPGDAEPGSGCSNEDRAGKPCDCGRDARVGRMLGLIAFEWDDHPEYKQKWNGPPA
jgi:hypothetical protein